MSIFINKSVRNVWKKSTYSFPVIPNKAFNTETETPGEFSKNVPSYKDKLTFVTMEDVFGGQFETNHVLFNPKLSKEQNERILKQAHCYHFKHHPITDDDLDMLTAFDEDSLDEFAIAYKKFLGIE